MKTIPIITRGIIVVIILILAAAVPAGCPVEKPAEPEKIVRFAANKEFIVEEEGLRLLEEHYGLVFDEVHELAVGLTHEALRAGDVDAAVGFTTDGKIKELQLTRLKDDKEIFPACNPAPVVREMVLKQYPQVESIMAAISSRLDNQTMVRLNYRADLEDREPAEVAENWLLEEKIISDRDRIPLEGEPVVIGSKEFMEQKLLGQIAIIALKNAGIPVEERKPIAGTDAIRLALITGDIDFYWEYTGVAWNEIFYEEEIISDPSEAYRRVAERDLENGLIWLDYAPLNKSYTIMMRKEHAAELGVTSIGELTKWVEQVRAGE